MGLHPLIEALQSQGLGFGYGGGGGRGLVSCAVHPPQECTAVGAELTASTQHTALTGGWGTVMGKASLERNLDGGEEDTAPDPTVGGGWSLTENVGEGFPWSGLGWGLKST